METTKIYPEAPPHYGDVGYNGGQPPANTHFMTAQAPMQVMIPTVQQTQALMPNILGPSSCLATCPNCNTRHQTVVTYEPNSKTHILAALMFLLGCICCFCVPYCTQSCQTAIHKCSRCGAFVGSYKN